MSGTSIRVSRLERLPKDFWLIGLLSEIIVAKNVDKIFVVVSFHTQLKENCSGLIPHTYRLENKN